FFSSRRRHTRFSRDWSSDVCSSDLRDGWEGSAVSVVPALGASPVLRSRRFPVSRHEPASDYRLISKVSGGLAGLRSSKTSIKYEIGRASCRERGEIGVGA